MINQETAELCARWWADRLEIEERREAFRKALIPKIAEDMFLAVDYDPDDTLLEALHEAGIQCRGALFSARGILPEKTRMRINNSGITVNEGYGGKYMPLEK